MRATKDIRRNPCWSIARVFVLTLLLSGLGAASGCAQGAKLELGSLEVLAHRAQQVTDVTLDQQMLQLAANFMSHNDQARQLVQGLKGIYIRSYEFRNKGEYSQAEVDAVLTQLHTKAWQKIVSNRDSRTNETDEVCIMSKGNSIRGLAIIAAEPTELTVVNIVGSIDLRKLSDLEGHFGIPHLNVNQKNEAPATEGSKQ
jgi:hypothetical protein